ncbi:MAG: Ig-like domain-containing protein, partial [Gemmatimonadales bacterium]
MTRFPRTGTAHASLLAGGLVLLGLVLANLQSCANVQPPRGGPPDSIPPALIAVYPDSYAVVSWTGKKEKVRFEFDEPISEQNLQLAALLYPFEPRPNVDKGKQELRVRPRAGWVADRLYHVRIEPVVQDLFRNRIADPIHHTISTGVSIPENSARGSVFDRIKGERLPNGRIDMVLLPDSLRYGGIADTSGAFGIDRLPVGDYYAIGYEDLNNNMRADDFDRSDTLVVSLGQADTLALQFHVFKHDTAGPLL